MAFKDPKRAVAVPDSPDLLFRTLIRRKFPTEMPHQRAILQAYASNAVEKSDVALQLPTGSGKTLVGLLIGEWRRQKYGERVVYLCPTKQLVNQTKHHAESNYGLNVVEFTGSQKSYKPEYISKYRMRDNIAITTYSSLFNSRPFFHDAELIIVDDCHAAENYIASAWSVEISGKKEEHKPAYSAIANLVKPYLLPQSFSKLMQQSKSIADGGWVEKVPTPALRQIASDLINILDANADAVDEISHPWSMIRDHLDACQVYLSSGLIVIKPLIPPTWDFIPFAHAKQRIYMSATLGAGGDLERLTGREAIYRLPVPEGFELEGVGRRFFMFPGMSLSGAEADRLRLDLMKVAKRSLVLTSNDAMRNSVVSQVKERLGFPTFSAADIESSKKQFIETSPAVAVLAARYDGIDFPKDECRLLFVDGMPKAMNLQERFIMSRMCSSILFNDRIQTRVLQAIGRCTRSFEDYSAVVVMGSELQDYLIDSSQRKYFYPELQAELAYGAEQSMETAAEDFVDNFKTFIENGAEWEGQNRIIISEAASIKRMPFPAMNELAAVVRDEVKYQKAMWQADFGAAMEAAERVLGGLTLSELRGYRALWHYLAGSAAFLAAAEGTELSDAKATQHFNEAKKAAPGVRWLVVLAGQKGIAPPLRSDEADVQEQVENLEAVLEGLGTLKGRKYDEREREILSGLESPKTFEQAHRLLGEILGFEAAKVEADGSPDPWWICGKWCFVFEDYLGANPIGPKKARQASGHPNWIVENVPHAKDLEIIPVLLSDVTVGTAGAKPHLSEVCLWQVKDFKAWAAQALGCVREIRRTLTPPGDLTWRVGAAERLDQRGFTGRQLAEMLKRSPAIEVMTFDGSISGDDEGEGGKE